MESTSRSSCSTPDLVFSPGNEVPSDQSTHISYFSDREDVTIHNKESQMRVSYRQLQWSFLLSSTQETLLLPHLENFPQHLLRYQDDLSDSATVEISSVLLLASSFLEYLNELQIPNKLLQNVVKAFEQDFLSDIDIHSLAVGLDALTRTFLLRTYYSAIQAAHLPLRPAVSALSRAVEAQDAHIYAVFGGQGTDNPACLKQLRELVTTYVGLLDELIEVFVRTLDRLICLPRTRAYFEIYGFDIKKWLAQPSTFPDENYIASSPVSFPLIGLISLSHYYITCKTLGKHPGEMRKLFRGVTGHSQGIIVAATIAQSNTWESINASAESVAETLFWIGFESHHSTALGNSMSAAIVRDSIACGEQSPSPMLSIRGLDRAVLKKVLDEANKHNSAKDQIYLSLVNSRDNIVVAGPSKSLRGLSLLLRNLRADDGLDQSRLPFHLRKAVVQLQFLPISAAFHSPHLCDALARVLEVLPPRNFLVKKLGLALYDTRTGEDLRNSSSTNLQEEIVKMVMTDCVDWPKACHFPEATHILDFGPGHVSSLTRGRTYGSGIRVIMASELRSPSKRAGSKAEIFSPHMHAPVVNWGELYKPRLTKNADGEVKVVTKMTELFGTPPVMVAGMTPTTVHWDFVSAVILAGYHVELAGGGYSNPNDFETAIQTLSENIPCGRGITCNLIYVAPRSMAWQIPLIRDLNRRGVLIDGLTIGAGIPSTEVVKEYIETLGLKHISFKPGTYDAIMEVIDIAKTHSNFPIGLQWTGGRGGGHHSSEDFHEPIIKAYGLIRECSNIVLIAGSGFGGAEDTYPYLTGEWSSYLGYPRMPFDGMLLGSRMMVAKEAHTSRSAKRLIVEAQGVTDSQWTGTYKKATGGVLTVTSEMGQPIHKLATRGVLLWHELDAKIFSIKDPVKRLTEIRQNRTYILKRLNKDYQKPWFGINSAGRSVDIEDMTYMEVLRRLVFLMYVKDQRRWIHTSYKTLFLDVTTRVQERLATVSIFSKELIVNPPEFLLHVAECFPSAETQVMQAEDARYILGLFGRRGQKPVNFVPALDERFEQWFKKDSLWQAEDIEAVIDRDVQRICIIHGPVAASHSKVIDEPVKMILDEISRSHITMLQRDCYAVGDVAGSNDTHSLKSRKSSPFLSNIGVTESVTEKVYIFPKEGQLPENDLIVAELTRGMPGWVQACLSDSWIFQGRNRQPNPVRSVFTVRHGDLLIVYYGIKKEVNSVSLSRVDPCTGSTRELAKIASVDRNRVTVTLFPNASTKVDSHSIDFRFDYTSGRKGYGLSEDLNGRNERIKDFYASLWIGRPSLNAYLNKTFHGGKITLSKALICEFMTVLGHSKYDPGLVSECLPMDIGIFIAWEALVMPLLTRAIDGDLLRLLHQSNKFEYFQEAKPFQVGDILETTSRVGSIITQTDRKLVEVIATIRRQGEPVMAVTSVFIIQGTFTNYESSFRSLEEPKISLKIASRKTEALLRSRNWMKLDDEMTELIGRSLIFKLNSRVDYNKGSSSFKLHVNGEVYIQVNDKLLHRIGKVHFDNATCHGNPVMDFLKRYGALLHEAQDLTNPEVSNNISTKIQMPLSNSPYSRSSKDTNPIHTSRVFSSYVQLPGPITHGMYTSAAVRRTIEMSVAEADPRRFRKYSASFQGMVLPGNVLRVEWQHVAMIEGRMQVKIQAYNDQTNTKVLDAEGEIEQAPTTYIFTGQGSQEKGMGMELYKTSKAAREIWDRGDSHLMNLYGFSIIEIVQKDPKKLTLHFGGVRGRQIRKNFLAMKTEVSLPDGTKFEKCIIPGLLPSSASYTFQDVRGLLYSTQFAQPALILMQMAVFIDLKSKGLIQSKATFAGHSLGEYAALGALTSFMPLESLLDLVFYRGLAMQSAIERDDKGQTQFSMVAVNPSRIGKGFRLQNFEKIIEIISNETGLLLEVVNHNVEGQQYVCAGHLHALWLMTQLFDRLSKTSELNASDPEDILELVREFAPELNKLPRMVGLERGVATIPLSGIDIPFHSNYLRGGIDSYRNFLCKKISEHDIDPEKLVGKFIPNVMGSPFSTQKDYIEKVAEVTGSTVLKDLIT